MNSRERCLEEQLRRKESESTESRGNLEELRTKFFQLERAFEINLRLQSRREVDFNSVKHQSQELRKLNDEILQAKAKLRSTLLNAVAEKDHWKNAYLRQKEFINRNNVEYTNATTSIKRECEDILRASRTTTEKQFHELIQLYNGSKEKVTQLEEQAEVYQSSQREYENRTFELANLLETLKRFDVDVGSVCQLVTEVLKNLTEQESLFEESMKNLRRLTWNTIDRNDEPELLLLRKQNSVLKEVVKNLKRKVQQHGNNERPQKENEQHHGPEIKTNLNSTFPNSSTFNGDIVQTVEASKNSLAPENFDCNMEKREERIVEKETNENNARASNNPKKDLDNESKIIDTQGRVFCIESHSNGVFFEEYVLKLSTDREMKIKYPVSSNNSDRAIKMEFLDNENEYDRASLDGMSIFLKNIYAFVTVKQTGVSCGTQTAKIKTSNNFAQTTVTGINTFSRLNVGVTMLNSEKRAIERSLFNLERTVETLKASASGQARTMLGKSSQFLGNDLFRCEKMLTR